ncbi:MAG: 2-C-methyl-D-erythritol 2,4-cyclodiphosphate synthase [Firmicutes bacterium]|nr:2-C-methyl-D-erythritol 2,4-cyclodiphosphate synthase [Bacillota bacterium]
MPVGIGYDVHRLVAGRPLVLGGVNIPAAKGLLGHSDADVLTHAIIDALLGAACLGDIGRLFPDNDPQYEGCYSLDLLATAYRRVWEKGYLVKNIDATVIAEQPKLAPHIEEMRQALAHTLDLDVERVSIKATTNEGLGFLGRGEGIAALAVCQLECRKR